MPKQPPVGQDPVTPEESVVALLRKSQRRQHVAIRRTFVQQGTRSEPLPGPLATFVGRRDVRGLDLLLLQRALATKDPFDAKMEAGAWARLAGLDPVGGVAVVSRGWARLCEMKLVSKRRSGRLAVITSLREDGSGDTYTRPSGRNGDTYFQLPLAYWLDGLYRRLSLRAKAMFLICLTLQEWSPLPTERVQKWYGISADTAERGLEELLGEGLVFRRAQWRRAPLVAYGFTKVYEYAVNGTLKRPRKLIASVPGVIGASKAG